MPVYVCELQGLLVSENEFAMRECTILSCDTPMSTMRHFSVAMDPSVLSGPKAREWQYLSQNHHMMTVGTPTPNATTVDIQQYLQGLISGYPVGSVYIYTKGFAKAEYLSELAGHKVHNLEDICGRKKLDMNG